MRLDVFWVGVVLACVVRYGDAKKEEWLTWAGDKSLFLWSTHHHAGGSGAPFELQLNVLQNATSMEIAVHGEDESGNNFGLIFWVDGMELWCASLEWTNIQRVARLPGVAAIAPAPSLKKVFWLGFTTDGKLWLNSVGEDGSENLQLHEISWYEGPVPHLELSKNVSSVQFEMEFESLSNTLYWTLPYGDGTVRIQKIEVEADGHEAASDVVVGLTGCPSWDIAQAGYPFEIVDVNGTEMLVTVNCGKERANFLGFGLISTSSDPYSPDNGVVLISNFNLDQEVIVMDIVTGGHTLAWGWSNIIFQVDASCMLSRSCAVLETAADDVVFSLAISQGTIYSSLGTQFESLGTDGSLTTLLSDADVSGVSGFALIPETCNMYWVDESYRLFRRPVNGTQRAELLASEVLDFTIDVANHSVFWLTKPDKTGSSSIWRYWEGDEAPVEILYPCTDCNGALKGATSIAAHPRTVNGSSKVQLFFAQRRDGISSFSLSSVATDIYSVFVNDTDGKAFNLTHLYKTDYLGVQQLTSLPDMLFWLVGQNIFVERPLVYQFDLVSGEQSILANRPIEGAYVLTQDIHVDQGSDSIYISEMVISGPSTDRIILRVSLDSKDYGTVYQVVQNLAANAVGLQLVDSTFIGNCFPRDNKPANGTSGGGTGGNGGGGGGSSGNNVSSMIVGLLIALTVGFVLGVTGGICWWKRRQRHYLLDVRDDDSYYEAPEEHLLTDIDD